MLLTNLTRRRFAGSLAAAAAAALVPRAARAATPATTGAAPVAAPVAAPPPVAAAPVAAVPAGEIRLDSNENPYGPSPAVLEAMLRSRAHAARYPDAFETPLIEDLARHHGVAPENILLGCGSGEILRMADAAFLGGGRRVVAADPTFEAVLRFADVIRAEGVRVPLTADHRHDLPAMRAASDARTGLIYVCNPNNPTGTIVAASALEDFLRAVPKDVVVLVDEAYHHFVEDPAYASATAWFGRYPNLVVARTFSKIHGLAGMRLGYAVAAKERIDAMRPHAVWSNANVAVLEAGRAALADTEYTERLRRTMNDTRRRLCAALGKDGRRVIPSEANFVMIDMGADVKPVIEALRARGVFPGRRFPSMARWLRVSVGTPEETDAFLAALRAVAPPAVAGAA